MHTPTAAGRALTALVLAATLTGCAGAASGPSSGSSPRSSSPSPTRSPQIPADGLTLQKLGYRFGPVAEMSLPRTADVTSVVDQANNVTAVLAAPPAGEVAAYLRRSLPLAGFDIAVDNGSATEPAITFSGHGWNGSFTGDEHASAVLLRPR